VVEKEIMPAAIQRFTLADRELKAKKKAELKELKTNPEPLPAAQEFFLLRRTVKTRPRRLPNYKR